MRKIIFLYGFLLTIPLLAQKQSWTTYFPVSNDVIGHTFIGKDPLDAKVQLDIENVTVRTSRSAYSFTKEQKNITQLIWNKLFTKNSLKLADIKAYGVKIDQITKETQSEMPRNIPFVYAGLKADSCIITFRKSKKMKMDSSPIIDSLKKIYPNITETEVGKFADFLKFTSSSSDSTEYYVKIKDPDVYFLIQVAEIDKVGGNKWDKYCASFLSLKQQYVPRFTLVDSLDYYKTGRAETHFSWTEELFDKKQKASVWLEIDKDKNLVVHSQISPVEPEKKKIITERNGTWNYDNIVVRSYPYTTGSNSESYKDIILIINAKREGNKIIIESGATNKICGRTFLNYPQSQFRWIKFSI